MAHFYPLAVDPIIIYAASASLAIKNAQRDLDSLLEKHGASTEREWGSIVQLLRDDLVKTSDTLNALIKSLYRSTLRGPQAIEAIRGSPSTVKLRKDIRALEIVVQDSVNHCASRPRAIENHSWWDLAAFKATQRTRFNEAMNNKISLIQGYCKAILKAQTEIVEAASRAVQREVEKLTAKFHAALRVQSPKKDAVPLAEIFSLSPFRLVASRTDPQTNILANRLLYIYRKCGLEYFRKLFEEMGEIWANEAPRTGSIANIEAAHRVLSVKVASALGDSIKAPIINSMLEDTRSTMSRLTAWGNSSATSNLIIAIGGEFSNGKSSLLNALMGAKFLPTGRTFVTAIPCRIVHDGMRTTASLEIPRLGPYKDLHDRVKGFDTSTISAPEGTDQALSKADVDHYLHKAKMANFLQQVKYEGQESVLEQLDCLNTLVRIGDRLGMEPGGLECPEVWPVVSIDIAALSGANIRGRVQFLDLPGFHDSLLSTTKGKHFAKMMQRAAEQATLVVPVLMQGTDKVKMVQMYDLWKQVLTQKSWEDRIPAVIVSRATVQDSDSLRRESLQLALAETAWGDPNRSYDVLCCDSHYALAAVQLEKALRNAKSPEDFEDLAKRVKNNEDPMGELNNYIDQTGPPLEQWSEVRWEKLLKTAVERSGINVIRRNFTHELCNESPRRRIEYFNRNFTVCFDILISRHYRVLRDEKMSDDDFRDEQADEERKIEQVQRALRTLPKAVVDIAEMQDTHARNRYQQFKDDVDRYWALWVKTLNTSLEEHLDSSRSSDVKKVLRFADKNSLHKVVQARLNGLASNLLDIQRNYVQDIISYATSGISEAVQTVKAFILRHITDPDLQTILNNHLDELSTIQNAVVVCIQIKLREATKQAYPRQVLLEMLHRWHTQSILELIDISDPVTPANDPSQPASTPTDTASEHQTPGGSDPEMLANREVDKSGFLLSPEISPEDLCALLSIRAKNEYKGALSITLTNLVNCLKESFLEPYLNKIETKTRDTMQGPIRQTQQACESMMNRILGDRQAEMKERFGERLKPDQSKDRVLHHLIPWGNLVAARAASRILFERLNKIPRLVTSRNLPSTPSTTSRSTPSPTP